MKTGILQIGAVIATLVAALPAVAGEVVVATRQVQLKTHTVLFSYPVEAQRGEGWEILKKGKRKVVLTFGPDDPRREALRSIMPDRIPEYEVDVRSFVASFVPAADWPKERRTLAVAIQRRFPELKLEDCERLIDGEVWVGLKKPHVQEAVGNRILGVETRETVEGRSEVWRIGAFGLLTTAQSTAEQHVDESVWLSSPRRPEEPLDVKAARDLEANTRLVLFFKNDVLVEITRK